MNVVVEETGETVVDGEGFVALANAVSYGSTSGGVHATSGSSNTSIVRQSGKSRAKKAGECILHDGNPHPLVIRKPRFHLKHGRRIETFQTLAKLRITKRHGLIEVLVFDRLRHFVRLERIY